MDFKYQRWTVQLGYEVAVKELNVGVDNEVIMKEARKMWEVTTCPYIVQIMGITENPEAKSVGIVMEFLEHGDLLKFNRKFMMDGDCMARKIEMVHEIALGMNFLHNQNPPLIHRDLKLENVFVGRDFIVKIGDLGLALGAQTVLSMQKKSEVDVSGTFTHIPPEGFSSESIPDKFWDIFTFAITVFELASGKNPWLEHGDYAKVGFWVRDGQRPNLKNIPTVVPSVIVELIKKCWAQTPSDRPPFHDILKIINSIRPTKPELRKANAAINGRIDMIEEAGDGIKDPETDSGTDSAWGGLEEAKAMSISDKEHSKSGASRDSGIGSQHSKEWELMQTFGQEGDKDGEFRQVQGIAVCKNGDIVVTNRAMSRSYQAYMFKSEGTYKFTFQSHPTNPEGKLKYPSRVAVTPGGDVVISDQSNLVKIFSASGEYLKSLSTVTAECNNSTKYETMGVAISPSGVVYIGDTNRKVITVHDMDRQQPIKKLSVHIKPYHLSSDPDNNIWVSDGLARQVIRYSDSGVELCRIKSFIVDNKAGKPQGAVYGKGSVYIAVMEVDEEDGKAILTTGHMHQYTRDGQFQRCIIKGMYGPYGIAMSNGKLYVANTKSVLVYEQQ
ncbi:uncharacterized protein [Amphiura filiformis]|uniref:uncharacterized protein n=1 Tax=Amphiura filiformis TaxID=82378 RepID=UPI003B21C4DD